MTTRAARSNARSIRTRLPVAEPETFAAVVVGVVVLPAVPMTPQSAPGGVAQMT